jgi:hypothetical protein
VSRNPLDEFASVLSDRIDYEREAHDPDRFLLGLSEAYSMLVTARKAPRPLPEYEGQWQLGHYRGEVIATLVNVIADMPDGMVHITIEREASK